MSVATKGALSLLAHGPFRRLWLGQTTSLFGDVLSTTVFLWLVTEITTEAIDLSVVTASALAPRVLLSLHAGAVVDRFDRRTVLVASDLVGVALQALLVLVILLVPRPPLPALCAFAFVVSCAASVGRLARSAAVPRLVPPEDLLPALSLNEASDELVPILGLGLSALVLSALFAVSRPLGFTLTFAFNGLTFLVSALLALGLPRMPRAESEHGKGGWGTVREGLRFLPSRPYLVQAILVAAAVTLLVCAAQPPLVFMARHGLGGGPSLLAALQASVSVGSVLGALLALRVRPARPGPVFSLSLLATAACVLPLAFTGSIALFLALQLAAGVSLAMAMVTLNAAFQLAIPDEVRGRVNGADQMVGAIAAVVGSLASGWVTDRFGVASAYLAIGIGFAGTAIGSLLAPELRGSTLARRAEVREAPTAPAPPGVA